MADHDAAGDWDLIVAPWHLDEHIPAFPVPVGVAETICPSLPDGTVPGRMAMLHRAVAGAVARAARPLLLSGDCPAALGAVAGLQRRYRDLAVVWLDAHGDFNTPAITISGYLGGMALAMLAGRAPGLSRDTFGLRPVAETGIVLADARDLDPAERAALAASQVRRVPADPAAITSALNEFGRKPVYLHLDVDVIDSAQLPGLRFPSGPGPSITQIEECLAAICATADVKAACIACAWLPDRISDQATRESITRLAGALGADLAWQADAQLRVIKSVVNSLGAAGISAWLFGGWGLDARIGRITREHGDVEFWVERIDAERSKAVLVGGGAAALATQPPEESCEFAWDGVDFSTAYFDRHPDGSFIQLQGRWSDWLFPPGSFADEPGMLDGEPVLAMSVAGMLAMKEQYPHLRNGRPWRQKDIDDIKILRRLAAGADARP